MAFFWPIFGVLLARFPLLPCYPLIMRNLTYDIFVEKFLGSQDMEAFGRISPLYLLMSTISKILAVGASTCCGTLLGKGNIQKAREVFHWIFDII